MPTDVNLPKENLIYQREQYEKGGISKKYWLFKDDLLIKHTLESNLIVDIGCGEGILLEKMIKNYPKKEIIGIDAEEENIQICRQHGLDARKGSAYNLSFEDNTVDCIIFSEVIEHLDRPEQAIGEISRILKKSGILIILFPNDAMFKLSRIMMLMIKEAFFDTGHVLQWTPRKIRTLLPRYNLNIMIQKNIPFYFWPISLHHMVVASKV